MDQRIKNLESTIVAIAEHSIEQNKVTIESNHSLINELRDLREIVSKQDEELRNFKTSVLNQLQSINIQLQQHQAFIQTSTLLNSMSSFSQFSAHSEQQRVVPQMLPQTIQTLPSLMNMAPPPSFFKMNGPPAGTTQQQQRPMQIPVVPSTYSKISELQQQQQQQDYDDEYEDDYEEGDENDYLIDENEATTHNLIAQNLQFSFGTNYQSANKSAETVAAEAQKPQQQQKPQTVPDIKAATAAKPTAPSTTNFFGTSASASLFPSIKPVNTTVSGEEDDGGEPHKHPEEYEPSVDFKPVVKLEPVEVKSGEEDEETLFKEHCKLYRFDSQAKDWKEKGTGEIKILKHKKQQNTYRLLMRRDQVFKVCLNQRIVSDTIFEVASDKTLRWLNSEFVNGEQIIETLLIKFKNEAEAKKFKSELDRIQKQEVVAVSAVSAPKPNAIDTKSQVVPSTPEKTLSANDKTKFSSGSTTTTPVNGSSSVFKFGQTESNTGAPTSSLFQFGSTVLTPPSQVKSAVNQPQSSASSFSFSNLIKQTSNLTQSKSTPAAATTKETEKTPLFQFQPFASTTPAPSTTKETEQQSSFLFKPFGSPTTPVVVAAPPPTSVVQNLLFAPSKLNAAAANITNPADGLFKFGATTPEVNKTESAFKGFDTKSSLGFADIAAKAGTGTFLTGQGTSNLFQQKPQQLFASQAAKPTLEVEDHEGVSNENPEEYEPSVDFKPIVKLEAVEVKTGEEDEEVLYKERCKLYRYDTQTKEWKEKGVGELKILKHKQHDSYRLLMRRDQVLKVCLNQRINAELKFEAANDKSFRWIGNSKIDGQAVFETLLMKFKNETEAKKFKAELDRIQSLDLNSNILPVAAAATEETKLKPTQKPLSELFKNDNKWNCTGCLVQNNNTDNKCLCCGTAKPGSEEQPQACDANTVNTFLNTVSTKPVFGGPVDAAVQFKSTFALPQLPTEQSARTTPFKFGAAKLTENGPTGFSFSSLAKETNKLLETSKTSEQEQPAVTNSLPGAIGKPVTELNKPTSSEPEFQFKPFNTTGSLSFGDLAKAGQPTLFGANKGFFAQPTPIQVFSSQLEHEEESHEHPEEYEPNVDFKPLVKLEAVEVRTGEEEEEVMFKERSKLYRFELSTKEWKEKGVGELKILKHKLHGTYRLLMRRDQVLKVCLNHKITNEIKFEASTEKSVCWTANDFSEGTVKLEALHAKFKSESEAKKFMTELDKIQKLDLKTIETASNDTSAKTPAAAAATSSTQKPLAELFKNDDRWKCSACLAPNDNKDSKCACCDAIKPGAFAQQAPLFGSKTFANGPSNLDKSKFVFGSISNTNPVVFGATSLSFGSNPPAEQTNDECIIVNTVTATKEDVDKARKFQLPDNFYLYEKKDECKGCRGCQE